MSNPSKREEPAAAKPASAKRKKWHHLGGGDIRTTRKQLLSRGVELRVGEAALVCQVQPLLTLLSDSTFKARCDLIAMLPDLVWAADLLCGAVKTHKNMIPSVRRAIREACRIATEATARLAAEADYVPYE